MTLCPNTDGKQCRCQPDEGVPCRAPQPEPAAPTAVAPVVWQYRYVCPKEGPGLWMSCDNKFANAFRGRGNYEFRPLYLAATPPRAALTPEQIVDLWACCSHPDEEISIFEFARAIEAVITGGPRNE